MNGKYGIRRGAGAIVDYRVAHDRVGQQRFREADNWIHRQGRDWTFTFDNLCEMLGIEPDYLRRRVIEEQKSGNMAWAKSEYLQGTVKPRHSPKRASIGGLVEVLDRG